MITDYTVILNDYDHLRPPTRVNPAVDYVCFSDEGHQVKPWRIVPAPRPVSNDTRSSRVPKILSHMCLESDYSIYHDACLVPNVDPADLIGEFLDGVDLALYRHPCRYSLADEVAICDREGIGNGPEMSRQASRYIESGLLRGLWAGGVIIRRHTEAVRRFNLIWWDEFKRGCARDQIALQWALKASGIKFRTIDADILQDPDRFQFHFHAAFKDQETNLPFEAARQRRIARRDALWSLCR